MGTKLVVTLNTHPAKKLSPNTPKPSTIQGRMGMTATVKSARADAYDAMLEAFRTSTVMLDAGVPLDMVAHVVQGAGRMLPRTFYTKNPDPITDYVAIEGAGLGWLLGPLVLETKVWWGNGDSIKDSDNLIGQCKAYRDGLSDFLGISDRKWTSVPPAQIKRQDNPVYGKTVFTLRPGK